MNAVGESGAEPGALVVLGCRVVQGRPSGALRRRLERAAAASANWPSALVVVSGGKAWDGHVEADVMSAELDRAGVRAERLLLERSSRTTRENAIRSAELLKARAIRHVAVVTCDFHARRACHAFRRAGFVVTPIAARSALPWPARLSVSARELGAWILEAIFDRLDGARRQRA